MKVIQGRTGDKVNIYQDPITRKKLEGVASLKQFICKDDEGMERWMVEFTGDSGYTFERNIMF